MSVLSSLSRRRRLVAGVSLAVGIVMAAVMVPVSPSVSRIAYAQSSTTPPSVRLGVYGTRWADWVERNPDAFDFMIFQMGREKNDKHLDAVAAVSDQGVQVMAMQKLYKGARERFKRKNALADDPVEVVADRIAEIYADPRAASISRISLDEENIWWGGRADYLADVYAAVKARMPYLQVSQWFNDHKKRRGFTLPMRYAVPADGHFLDPFSVPLDEYEERIASYAATGRPLTAVLWGSPEWAHGRGQKRLPTWWEDEGWQRLYAQMRVHRKYGIDTSFILFDLVEKNGRNRLIPIFKSSRDCAQTFLTKFVNETMPAMRSGPLYDPTPAVRPAWMAGRCG